MPNPIKKPVTKTKITTAKGTKVKNKLKKGTIKVKIKSPSGSKQKFVVNTDMESLNTNGRQTLSDPNKYKSRRAAKKGSPAKKEGDITIKGKKATVKNGSVYKNGNYVGPVGSKDLKPDKNNLKPSKAALAADAKKKADAKNEEKGSPAKMSGRSYDMKMAYDKKLTPKARLHYLENERHDAPGKMKGSPYHMSNELKYGGPVIDQMKTLSQIGTSKVLRHMKK